jgi:hypothetical protein
MSGVPSHRTAVVRQWLVIVCAVAALTSCAYTRHVHFVDKFSDLDPGPCRATGNDPAPKPGSPDRPIVCVDDRNMTDVPIPDVVAKRNAVINWFTVTGQGSISVVFNDRSPVKRVLCGQNKAYCHAVIDLNAEKGDYLYSVIVTRGGMKKVKDPTVQVDPGVTQWAPP